MFFFENNNIFKNIVFVRNENEFNIYNYNDDDKI